MAKSVRPSVTTLVSHALTVTDIEIFFMPYDIGTHFLVSGDQILQYRKSFYCLYASLVKPSTALPPSENLETHTNRERETDRQTHRHTERQILTGYTTS